jgi:hypothetical protein
MNDDALDAGIGVTSNSSPSPNGCKENKLLRVQTPKIFVSETALEAGTQAQNSYYASRDNHAREKRSSIFDKLTRKNSKPKKRISILSTEYTHKQPKENVQLNTTNLLFGVLERPVYNSSSFDKTMEHNPTVKPIKIEPVCVTATNLQHKPTAELNDQHKFITNAKSSRAVMDCSRTNHSLNLGTNISRYVNIFCNMSKRKKYKDAMSLVSSENSSTSGDTKTKIYKAESPQTIDFVQRTRKLFNDGRGKYDIAEAAIRASFTDKVSGLSYVPLSLEEHGHDCRLQSSVTFRQELNY